MAKAKNGKNKELTSDETMTAILSYLGILVFIPLLAVKSKNDFIKFHIRQGISLFIIEVITAIAQAILYMIPIIGWVLGMVINILWILILICVIVAIIKALQKEMWKIPVADGISKNIKIK